MSVRKNFVLVNHVELFLGVGENAVFKAFLVSKSSGFKTINFQNKNGDIINIDGTNYSIGRNGVELQAIDGFRGQLAIIKAGEEPELISANLIFDKVPPDDDKKNEYKERQYKKFTVSDINGLKYEGKMYE